MQKEIQINKVYSRIRPLVKANKKYANPQLTEFINKIHSDIIKHMMIYIEKTDYYYTFCDDNNLTQILDEILNEYLINFVQATIGICDNINMIGHVSDKSRAILSLLVSTNETTIVKYGEIIYNWIEKNNKVTCDDNDVQFLQNELKGFMIN